MYLNQFLNILYYYFFLINDYGGYTGSHIGTLNCDPRPERFFVQHKNVRRDVKNKTIRKIKTNKRK